MSGCPGTSRVGSTGTRPCCAVGRPSRPVRDTAFTPAAQMSVRSEEHTSELQSQSNLVCRLLLEKKKKIKERILGACEYQCFRYKAYHSQGIRHRNYDE